MKYAIKRGLFVGLGVILQLILMVTINLFLMEKLAIVNIIYSFIRLILFLGLIRNSKNYSCTLPWIIILILFPIVGSIMYVVLELNKNKSKLLKNVKTSEYIAKRYLKQDNNIRDNFIDNSRLRYISDFAHYPVTSKNEVDYYGLGEKAFPVMLEELKKASKFIFLEYFIINNGIMWDSILKILEEKVSEGVEVRVIYDDAGCISTLKKDYNKFLESKGIKCVVFNKLNPLSGVIMNNRDHRKILIVDGRVAFSGGINISDEYINEKKLYGHWKDNAIKIVGEGVFNFTVLFLTMWNSYREEDKDYNLFKYEFNDTIKQDGFVVPYGETPLDSEIVGEDIYLNIINQSHKYLYIMTPYLIIDTDMINSLVLAAKRGVDVRIIIPGVPDKKIVYSLSESYLQILVEGGVKIYKYTPGFVHSKMFLSDDLVSVVGTINLDYRSLYLHFECGVYLEGHSSIKKIKNDFEESFKVSHKLSKKEVTPGLIKAIWQTVLRLFAPLM